MLTRVRLCLFERRYWTAKAEVADPPYESSPPVDPDGLRSAIEDVQVAYGEFLVRAYTFLQFDESILSRGFKFTACLP
jgi:hypothetical protein